MKTIAFLCSGGVASGMQEVVAKLTRIFCGLGYEVIGFRKGWRGLIEDDFISLTPTIVQNIGGKGGAIIGSCSRVNVFEYNDTDCSEQCYNNYKKHEIECLIPIGGDGTIRQGKDLLKKFPDMNIIQILGTMDRDVHGSFETIGFYTAVEEAARVIVANASDGTSMGRDVVVEVMGRDCSYVALYAALKAMEEVKIDIILVPEIQYSIEKIAIKMSESVTPLFIVMAEGAKTIGGKKATQSSSGVHAQLSGAAAEFGEELKISPYFKTNRELKTTVAGYTQRSGLTSNKDMYLADAFAHEAAKIFLAGKRNRVVVSDENELISSKTIFQMANLNKYDTPKGLSLQSAIFVELQSRGIYFGQ